MGASVPPLGLSNRSIFGSGGLDDGPSETGQPLGKAQQSIASHLTRPPTEEELHNHSLWCEVTKLYGQSLELLSLDVDLANGLIASSCKGTSDAVAGIRIHSRKKAWKEVQVLRGHSLDVTRVRFSPNGVYLASVSRDRTWRLFKRLDDGLFELVGTEEAHSRIIYDVAWSSSSSLFATASRDNSVKLWSITATEGAQICATLPFNQPLTALAFTSNDRLAVGDEKGSVYIYDCSPSPQPGQAPNVQQRCAMPALHSEAISELAWRPVEQVHGEQMLASSSLDGSVRLHRMQMQ